MYFIYLSFSLLFEAENQEIMVVAATTTAETTAPMMPW